MTSKQILFSFVLSGVFFIIGLVFREKQQRTLNQEDSDRYESNAAIMYLISFISLLMYVLYCIIRKYTKT